MRLLLPRRTKESDTDSWVLKSEVIATTSVTPSDRNPKLGYWDKVISHVANTTVLHRAC